MLQRVRCWLGDNLNTAKTRAPVRCLQSVSIRNCSEHDRLVNPVSRKPWSRLASSKKRPVKQTQDSPAAPAASTTPASGIKTHSVPKQRHVYEPIINATEDTSPGPGYGRVPLRADIPRATNEPLHQQDRKQHQPVNQPAKASSEARTPSRRYQKANLQPPKVLSKKQTPLTPTQALAPAQQQYDNSASSLSHQQRGNSVQKRARSREYDPGRAFMQAGMPSGLWVLPLEASSEGPPAPPPVAPEDPQELLKVLQSMPPPRRKLVIFKAGGYIYSDMEALIEQSGLSHVLRLTNLIRKANCVLAKPAWDNGKRVNLRQHQSAAEKAKVPFLVINQLDPVELVAAVRPLLIKRKTVVEQRVASNGSR